MEKGVPLQAVSRSIQVLQAINRHGSLTLMEIAQQAHLPYPTTCRVVQTLQVEGLVEREPDRKRYRPTALVHTLSHGYQMTDRLTTAARPHIVALTRKISWPVTLCTRVGQKMMVRDSTHSLTSLTFNNYFPGHTVSLLEASTGRAYLAYCPDEERTLVLEEIALIKGAAGRGVKLAAEFEGGPLQEIRRQGYATPDHDPSAKGPRRASSIAVPVFEAGQIAGSLAMIFFSSAITAEAAAEAFLTDLNTTARDIGADLAMAAGRAA